MSPPCVVCGVCGGRHLSSSSAIFMIHHVTLGYTMLCYAMAHKPHLSQIAVAVLWWMPPPLPPFSGGLTRR